MGQLGWKPNAVEEAALEAAEKYVEPEMNLPIYIDGYTTTIRDGLAHVAYWVKLNGPGLDGSERLIVGRHVMPQSVIMECRKITDRALLSAKRALDG